MWRQTFTAEKTNNAAKTESSTDPETTPSVPATMHITARSRPPTGGPPTALLDPIGAPSVDRAMAFAQRWEIESAFDELKTHQRGPRVVLRSKLPELVLQEIWGHLCCHYAISSLMTPAAQHAGHDPERISFTTALPIVRHTVSQQGSLPPSAAP